MRIVFFALGLLLLGAEHSYAHERRLLGRLNEGTPTVSEVMERAGCHPLWLDKVVTDSGLRGRNLRALNKGESVYFHGRTCRVRPPLAVQARTIALLRKDSSEDLVAKLREESIALKKTVTDLEKRVGDLQGKLTLAQNSLKAIESERNLVRSELSTLRAKTLQSIDWKALIVVGLAGFLLGLIPTIALFLKREKAMVWTRPIVMKKEGEKIIFPFVTVKPNASDKKKLDRIVQCPFCGTANLVGTERNLMAHLDNKCPKYERVLVRDPENLLGTSPA